MAIKIQDFKDLEYAYIVFNYHYNSSTSNVCKVRILKTTNSTVETEFPMEAKGSLWCHGVGIRKCLKFKVTHSGDKDWSDIFSKSLTLDKQRSNFPILLFANIEDIDVIKSLYKKKK